MPTILKAADNGMTVLVPDTLTSGEVDAIRLIVYHGATTCRGDWARDVFALEGKLKSLLRAADRLNSAADKANSASRVASDAGENWPKEANKLVSEALDFYRALSRTVNTD
jgi:hypothetical protein